MATKKPTPKKQAPPPPPKNMRMDIVLDPDRQEIIKKLSDLTGEKTNTKILFRKAYYYLNDKPRKDKELREAQEEIRVLKNELYAVKRSVSGFFDGLDDMRKAVSGKETPMPSNDLDDDDDNGPNFVRLCPNCNEGIDTNDIEDGECPFCNLKLKTPEGYVIDYPTGDDERLCPDCGMPCYINLSDAYFCPNCDEIKTEFDDE
ncbi:MAG: hypothetical protein WCP32_10290 [Bacteroidota bacterium]